MAARAAFFPDAHSADGYVHVVVHDDEVIGRELVPVEERPHRPAALIHERLRLHDQHLFRANARLSDERVLLQAKVAIDAELLRKRVGEHEAHVVLCLSVLGPGIAETNDDFQ